MTMRVEEAKAAAGVGQCSLACSIWSQLAVVTWSALGLLLLSGCGYVVGSGFPAEVRTIHVPTFESQSFRRGIEFQLTEAVQKEIQKRTHFRLAPKQWADTELTGRFVDARKDVLGETSLDDPRELRLSLHVEATWKDLRTGQILAQHQIPLDAATVQLVSQAEYAPEVGQSLATALQQSVDRLARRIVDMMETPW